MCGIFGIVSSHDVQNDILTSLKTLEYRGYDSAGIATISSGIHLAKSVGKLNSLVEKLDTSPLNGHVGIGHTRWATHGKPSIRNAHPMTTEQIALVHNGIIENYGELKKQLSQAGIEFETDTDTEVILKLIDLELTNGSAPQDAVLQTLNKLQGTFALALIFAKNPNLLIGAKRGSPLAFGVGDECHCIASDTVALSKHLSKATQLNDDEIVVLDGDTHYVLNQDKEVVHKVFQDIDKTHDISKGEYPHFMLKEIHEQSDVLKSLFRRYTNHPNVLDNINWTDFDSIAIIACGTSYNAGLVSKYWLEEKGKIPTTVEIASEFKYRDMPPNKRRLYIFISQSGETADTLAALKWIKDNGCATLGIVNTANSSIANLVDHQALTFAGPEIGVASTKAFTAQLMLLALLSLKVSYARKQMNSPQYKKHLSELTLGPDYINTLVQKESEIKELAKRIGESTQNILYIGRHTSFPLALEGALKLKELSYIFTEGVAAGELKHGPIALIDETVPVVVIAPVDKVFDKVKSNVQEIEARGGKVILLSSPAGIGELQNICYATVAIEDIGEMASTICYSIPLQLLAYYIALSKGKDVDRPRNLAKSVTVE